MRPRIVAVRPADTHGGMRIFGRSVRRKINLVALRALAVTDDGKVNEEESLRLRRYLLGLALVAGRCQAAHNLRQGCLLVLKDGSSPKADVVRPSGKRNSFTWEFGDALEFAESAARDFGVFVEKPEPREFEFQPSKVAEALKLKAAEGAAKKPKKTKVSAPAAGSPEEREAALEA